MVNLKYTLRHTPMKAEKVIRRPEGDTISYFVMQYTITSTEGAEIRSGELVDGFGGCRLEVVQRAIEEISADMTPQPLPEMFHRIQFGRIRGRGTMRMLAGTFKLAER